MRTILPLFLSTSLMAQNLSTDLDKTVSDTLKFWKVPGCAVTIIQKEEILLCKGYGVKKTGTSDPIDTHTRFPIASVTKAFTATALGLLVEKGTLTLDTPIQKFYPLKLSDSYATTHLTFRDCLSMRSGLPGPSTNSLLYAEPPPTREELLEKILPSLSFPLGFRSHFSYQNLLYLLAATAFTPSYPQFLQKQLLAPLEMQETLTSHAALLQCSNKVTPHLFDKDRYTPTSHENLDTFLPAAGLASSAHDMTHFLLFLLEHGTYHAKRILSPSTLSQVFTPQTIATVEEFTGSSTHQPILFPTAQFLTYGLGCFIHDYRGIQMIQVPGLTDGTVSLLALVPSHSLGIFLTTNSDSVPFTRALLYQLIDTFLQETTDWNTTFHRLSAQES